MVVRSSLLQIRRNRRNWENGMPQWSQDGLTMKTAETSPLSDQAAHPVAMEGFFSEMAEQFTRVSIARDIFDQWQKIGLAEGLDSDSQIAGFLVQQYHKCKGGIHETVTCDVCRASCPRICTECHLQQIQKDEESLGEVSLQPCLSSAHVRTDEAERWIEATVDVSLGPGLSSCSVKTEETERPQQIHNVQEYQGCGNLTLSQSFSDAATPVPNSNMQAVLYHSDLGVLQTPKNSGADVFQTPKNSAVVISHTPDADIGGKDEEFKKCQDTTRTESQIGDSDNELPISFEPDLDASENAEAKVAEPEKQDSLRCAGNGSIETFLQLHASNMVSRVNVARWLTEMKRECCEECSKNRWEGKNVSEECTHHPPTFNLKLKLPGHLDLHSRGEILRQSSRPVTIDSLHLNDLLKGREMKTHACEVCDKTFPCNLSLLLHKKKHSPERKRKQKRVRPDAPLKGRNGGHMLDKVLEGQKSVQTRKDVNTLVLAATGAVYSTGGRMHKGVKVHRCAECEAAFTNNCHLKLHMRTHTGERPFSCSECAASFTTNFKLKVHMRRHSNERPYVCDLCGKSFRESSVLKTHIRTHTGEKPYICKECGISFAQSSALKTHVRIHTGDRPHMCTVCGAAFPSSSRLDRHSRVHTGQRPYVCSDCGFAFKSSGELNHHMRTHTKYKPAVCKICSASFSQLGNMKIHMRTHTGEKPYVCEVCPAAFRQHGGLKMHMLMHTDERPCVCNLCGASYRKAQTLRQHKRKKHPEESLLSPTPPS